MTVPALSIVDTFDDPTLFRPWFPGDSWNAWRTILKAAFAVPLDDSERRAGKDSIASVVAAHVAAFFSNADRLRPGERALVLNLATDRDQAKICLNYVRAFFNSVPMLSAMVDRETNAGFE